MPKKEELVTLLCPKFYKLINSPTPDPVPGQIISAHGAHPPDVPWIIKVHSYDASNPARSQYEVKKFESGDQSHFPIAELQLRKDENYYVYRGKERPFVVLGMVKSRWSNPLKDETIFSCAPLFSFKPKHGDDFKIRSAGFVYPNLFYLPAETDGCSMEGAVRFEYIQPIARRALHNYLAGTPSRPVALSDEAFALFINHLGRFLFKKNFDSEVCETIDTYRSLVLEELGKIEGAKS